MDNSDVCLHPTAGPIVDGKLNDCWSQIYIQAGVTVLGLIATCAACAGSTARPQAARQFSNVDRFRGTLLILLLGTSVAGSIFLPPAEAIGCACRALQSLVVFLVHRWEVRHWSQRSLSIRLWWIVGLLDRFFLLYTAIEPLDGSLDPDAQTIAFVFLGLVIAESVLASVLVVTFFVCTGPNRSEPLLDDNAEAQELQTRWARTLSTREPSPEETINIFGALAFSWFTPIVDKATEKDAVQGKLEPQDLYRLCESDLPKRQWERLDIAWEVETRKEAPSLVRAMWASYKWDVARTAWLKVLNDLLHFAGPFFLNRILRFIQADDRDPLIGWVYAICMILSSGSQAILMAHYFQQGYRTGMRLRAGLVLLCYRKSLKVLQWATPPTRDSIPAAAPARRRWPFGRRTQPAAEPPARPRAQASGGMGQITNLISADTDKFTFLMPYFNLIWSCPLQLILCFVMLIQYVSWALLAGVMVMILFIFLSAWVQGKARKFQKDAMKAKDERLKFETELLKVVKVVKLYAWEIAIAHRVQELRNKEMALQLRYKLWNMGLFLSFSLSPTLVSLATFACYTLLLKKELTAATAFTALSLFNILNFPLSAGPMMARFFMEAKVAADRLQSFLVMPEVSPRPQRALNPNVAVELQASQLDWPDGTQLLAEVDFSVSRGEFVTIVGRVGAGKSGFLHALLGELPLQDKGQLRISGSVGYCAQTAWVCNASLKDNIVCGATNASDARYEAVLEACALRQDLDMLPNGDQTLIGDRGINLSGGQKQRVALARAVYADPEIYILDDVLSALDAHVASHICNQLLCGPLMKGRTVILVTHSKRALPLSNKVISLEDKKVKFSGTFEEFEASGVVEGIELKEDDTTAAADLEVQPKPKEDAKSSPKPNGKASPTIGARARVEERRSGAVSFAVYRAYAVACGGCVPVGFFLLMVVFSEGSRNASDGWLTHWTNSGGAMNGIGVYALIALVSLVTGMSYAATRTFLGQWGSKSLHEKCVFALLRAKMTFHDRTPQGQILNRLAEDTNILDYNLPMTLAANFVWYWRSAAIVVVCMLVGWYLGFLIIPMFFLYAKLAKRYLPATRDLRRLDAAAKSPIFSHFGETVAGVSTIRAMQQQDKYFGDSLMKLESQMEAYYLSNTAARWLSLRLQFNGTVLVGALVVLGIWLATSGRVSAGIVGLAITYALKLTDTLTQVNRESADRETQMVAVERIHNYVTDIEAEAQLVVPGEQVPHNWPHQGLVELKDVTMRYHQELPIVLDGVSLTFQGGHRVGICGRTGCGKSSLLMTLMRLTEIEAGSIAIDGIQTAEVGLHTLREKVAIIPQDPAILTGTVRFNLDPFKTKSDKELWEVLEKAQIAEQVKSREEGLDSEVTEGGGNYSVGQLQLLCLARALLRRLPEGGMLLLDEATSALDAETDQIIQRVIREQFTCTIITIAHRIDTLMDYDAVAVLSNGKVVEFDNPKALIQRPSSEFRNLAQEAGVQIPGRS